MDFLMWTELRDKGVDFFELIAMRRYINKERERPFSDNYL